MKNFNFNTLLILVTLMLISSCNKVEYSWWDNRAYSKHYINHYIDVNQLMYESHERINTEENILTLNFWGKIVGTKANNMAESIGDTHYNRVAFVFKRTIFDRFLSVDIISSRDFGEEYPAGSSLAGITRFYAFSAWDYIKNDYQCKDNGVILPEFAFTANHIDALKVTNVCTLYPINKLVSELGPDDLFLIFECVTFHFLVKPSPGEHYITISFRSEDKLVQRSMPITFTE